MTRNLFFPYGETNFERLITEQQVYQDRTQFIPRIEATGKNILLLRPRRFGKSLFLSTLDSYYDVAQADQFETLFGQLYIGQNPTPLHNRYFILRWDFSMVDPRGTIDQIKRSLDNNLNGSVEEFQVRYRERLDYPIYVDRQDAFATLRSVVAAVQTTPHRLYLLVDEYDNFANQVMVSRDEGQRRYKDLVQGEGLLKTMFKILKGLLAGRGLERIFMTGVSPVVMSDLTSGQFVARNIFFEPEFNDLCGFTAPEVRQMLQQVGDECNFSPAQTEAAFDMMQRYYNGYRFVLPPDEGQMIYNPTMVLYFLEYLHKHCRYPRKMLDSNLAPDRNKLRYVASIPNGGKVIVQAVDEQQPVTVHEITERFGVEDMLEANDNDPLAISLLYYLGMLTWYDTTDISLKLVLRIPNMTIRELYYDRLQKILLPDLTHNQIEPQAELFYTTANLQPVCDLVETRFQSFDNRDYRSADELLVKAMFLSLLFNGLYYLVDSEQELQRGYADLTMIVRPDMRRFELLDHVVEFKFVTLKEAELSGAELREKTTEELWALPAVQSILSQAKAQLSRYRTALNEIYRDPLRLHEHVVIGIGFERVLWKKLGR